MKTVITGAGGFIGGHLARALVERGDRVTCLVRRRSVSGQLAGLDVELAVGDVTDAESLARILHGADVVFHLAGVTKAFRYEDFLRVNEQGARNVAQACAALTSPPVLVAISSLAAAGTAPFGRPRTEEDAPVPVSRYGRSKLAGERAIAALADRLPITIVRPPIVFGEWDYNFLAMVRSINFCGLHAVPGFRRRNFSLIHVADLVHGLLLAAQHGMRISPQAPASNAAGYYYFSAEEHPPYGDLGRLLGKGVGRDSIWVLPAPEFVGWCVAGLSECVSRLRGRPSIVNFDKMREATAGSWTCSAERAREELGFRVAAPLIERVRQTCQWYVTQGLLVQRKGRPRYADGPLG